jgi:phage tail tape-measure protein
MNVKHAVRYATAASLALLLSSAYAADPNTTTTDKPMTGKEKATAIGAGSGAVAGAVVGGPVGAVVGAGVGAYVGHEGTDAQGKVRSTSSPAHPADATVRNAQAALETQGYNPGSIDGQMGPNTRTAILRFQQDKGLTQSGTLDGATLAALGVR